MHRKRLKRGKSLRIQNSLQKTSLHKTPPPPPPALHHPRCLGLNHGCQKWAILSLLGDTLGKTQSRLGICSSLSSAVGPHRALCLQQGARLLGGVRYHGHPSTWLLLLSHSVVSDYATSWTAARHVSLSITISQSSLKLMSIELVMPSNHLILCHPLLLPSVFPSIRVFFQ